MTILQMSHPKSERQVNHGNVVSIRIRFTSIIIANESCYMKRTNTIHIHFPPGKINFDLIRESENESASVQGLILNRMKRERKRIN